ncbi:DEAD box RNA helicase [Klebsormidium nitens]|uniref:RNA helicase n=1 Tax=Klebsormidium nitens TaxID=105231 RepID=A0A1Y1IMQ9_KLENI|nr:DEAD box RNA helicase [Klebsormidium nitens]|eukprot:GAQ89408.1 DEAD box RNA helicase [Klebsormidium nitens]
MAASMSLVRGTCAPSAALAPKLSACSSAKAGVSLLPAVGFLVPPRSVGSSFLAGDADLSSVRKMCRNAGRGGALQAQAVAEFVETREPLNGTLRKVTLPYSEDDSELENGRESDYEEVETESEPELAATDIRNFDLSKETVRALQARGIENLFAIQCAVIQPAMAGRDIIARARTGTGKTLAFGLPIIEKLLAARAENGASMRGRAGRLPKCLVMAPTRELAKQVEKEFMESAPSLQTVCVYGGAPISGQERTLRRGVDVAVGTPGRIMDLMERGALDLQEVRYMVLDEADQMLNVGFEEAVEHILRNCPVEQRQSMLFSATMPTWVRRLSRKYLNNPEVIDLVGDDDAKIPEGLKIMAVQVPRNAKRNVLIDLITVHGRGRRTIVFGQTKRDVDDIAVLLSRTHNAEALHGDIAQSQREKSLQGFRDGRFKVLVATDVASRGLDIPDVDLVIHYELPNDTETFVHRSGRTGRAGKDGIAIAMYAAPERRMMSRLAAACGKDFVNIQPPNPSDVLNAAGQQALEMLEGVDAELYPHFFPAAEQLIAERGPLNAVASALAAISGFREPPKPKSLLTFEEGWTTLQVVRSASGRGPIVSPRNVQALLGSVGQQFADNVGKIRLISDRDVDGAVFDLPTKLAKRLVEIKEAEGDYFDEVQQLPRLVEEFRGGDMGGRGGSRGGYGRGGGGGGYRERSGYGGSRSGGGGGGYGGSRERGSGSSYGGPREGRGGSDFDFGRRPSSGGERTSRPRYGGSSGGHDDFGGGGARRW